MKSVSGSYVYFLIVGPLLLFLSSNTLLAQDGSKKKISQNKVVKKFPTEANQGVAVDENYYYAISNTKITKHNKTTGEIITTWQADTNIKAFEHFKHMNSGTVVDGKLYVAHSRYKVDPNDNTIEVFNVKEKLLTHEKTIRMPRKFGSLTWADKHTDGSWWICYAVYGNDLNKSTRLIKYQFEDERFIEKKSWLFPKEVIESWGNMSCSGGSWGPDGNLYTTGHDHEKAFILTIDQKDEFKFLRIENNVGFYGQAIAWDRFSKQPKLWGIVKRKFITVTEISEL